MSKLQDKPSALRTFSISKILNLLTFFYVRGPFFSFLPSGSGYGTRDVIESGSITDPDPQHRILQVLCMIFSVCQAGV
jgi:hypothetical protein